MGGHLMAQTNAHDIKELTRFALDTVQRAGEAALRFYGKGQRGLKFDQGLVTEAELALEDLFREELAKAFPDHQIFNNALLDEDYTHEEKRYVWVYDPLDGIANFQAGIPIWGVSIALLENFWPLLGYFFMPATGDLFHATANEGAFYGREKIQAPERDAIDDESLLLVFSRFHKHFHSSFPGKMLNLGCTSAHICYVANGRADAAIVANESFQDLAAARVILEGAGGKFYNMDGNEIFLNEYLEGQRIDGPLLVTTPALCKRIKRHLTERV